MLLEGRASSSGRAFRGALVVCLALILANAFVYAHVWTHDFVNFDDPQYVSENPEISAGLTWHGVSWAFTTRHAANWHPLTWLSHMLDVQLHGLRPGPHHLTSVLLHVASSLVLFGLLHGSTGAMGRSGFVAGLFALHPLHVESVAWVAERKDVLSTLLLMLTLWAYVRYVRQPGAGRYGVVLVLFALGLLAKPMLVTLPFVLLLLDLWPLGRFPLSADAAVVPKRGSSMDRRSFRSLILEKIPLVALAFACSAVTLVAQQRGGAVKGLDALPFDRRLANAAVAYVAYIGQMLWPARLAAIYPYPRSLPGWQVAAAFAALAIVSAVALRCARRHPYLTVGWLWYLGVLVPVIGLVQVGSQPRADRYTYVPLIGLFIMVAWGMPEALARFPKRRVALPTAALLVLSATAIVARDQVGHWRDSLTLWGHALDVTTQNYRAHNNLGHALARRGRVAEAVAHYAEALRIKPDFAEAHNNLGLALQDQGRVLEAIPHYAEAVRLVAEYVEAHNNLGAALVGEGRVDEAILHLSEALRIKPDLAEAHNNLGVALAGKGQIDQATRHFQEALRTRPDYADAHKNLGLALAEQGRMDDAIGEYRLALRTKPDFPEAHNALGNALAAQGRIAEAVTHYEEALRQKPDDPFAHNGLGAALADQGNVIEATRHYSEALRINPDFAEAHGNLGAVLAKQGRFDEAIHQFREALRVRPYEPDYHYDLAVMLARKGETTEAVRQLESALKLQPGHDAARQALKALADGSASYPPGGRRIQ